jgi:hypothetical protein
MDNIRSTAKSLDGTFWIGNRDDSVYGIFMPDTSLYTNTDMPYRLTFRVYNSGYFVNADTFGYPGGIKLDGTLEILDGIHGSIQDRDTIFWNNGDVWNRVSDIPRPRLNGGALKTHMDINESSWLNSKINSAYPTWSQFPGM